MTLGDIIVGALCGSGVLAATCGAFLPMLAYCMGKKPHLVSVSGTSPGFHCCLFLLTSYAGQHSMPCHAMPTANPNVLHAVFVPHVLFPPMRCFLPCAVHAPCVLCLPPPGYMACMDLRTDHRCNMCRPYSMHCSRLIRVRLQLLYPDFVTVTSSHR